LNERENHVEEKKKEEEKISFDRRVEGVLSTTQNIGKQSLPRKKTLRRAMKTKKEKE